MQATTCFRTLARSRRDAWGSAAAAGVTLWLQVDGMGDVTDALALGLFGITAEPHFAFPLTVRQRSLYPTRGGAEQRQARGLARIARMGASLRARVRRPTRSPPFGASAGT